MLNVGNSTDGRLPLDASAAGQLIPPVTLSDGSRGAGSYWDADTRVLNGHPGEAGSDSATALNVNDQLLLSSQPTPEPDNPFIVLVRHRFGAEIDV
jgi:hypothetical protein